MILRRFAGNARSSLGLLLLIHQGNIRLCYPLSSRGLATVSDVGLLINRGTTELSDLFDFPLDDWQLQAGGAICNGYNVIVSAPTGAGKTVVGEMALHWALANQQRGIYTTPLKALSNEKFRDFCGIFGRTETGLSTGDISINKGAIVSVMTTEVYRNIAWRSSIPSQDGVEEMNELDKNAVVVLDELHYMGQPGRGGVWEECIITSPQHTQIVGLSATLSNGPELAAWMESVTNRRTVLVDVPGGKRPVPLRFMYATKAGLGPLFRDPDAGPGAPKGLLGYRGDGIATVESIKKRNGKRKGFSKSENPVDADPAKLPRGLNVNPALTSETAKRLIRVDRAVERKKTAMQFGNYEENFDDFENKSFRGSTRKMTSRQEQRERERLVRKELRRSVPSIHAIVHRLNRKDLLPAGCDNAASMVARCFMGPNDPNAMLADESDEFDDQVKPKRKTRQRGRQASTVQDRNGREFRSAGDFLTEDLFMSMMDEPAGGMLPSPNNDDRSPLSESRCRYYGEVGLLSYDKVVEVASKVTWFNSNNEEIQFGDELIEQYLLGVGSHHAGLLPAHKSFVELLFQNQLMKVVFSTETLAAGINMPARTTVICALAKRGSSSSMELLETSNLLQMAGRAGRRGKDVDGTCVILATPFETHDDAARILLDEIKPIDSQFSPSYSLCVNLIARGGGTLSVAEQLVSKSFAMWKRSQEEDKRISVGSDSSRVDFLDMMVQTLKDLDSSVSHEYSSGVHDSLWSIMEDRRRLKKASKSLIGTQKTLDIEQATLQHLESAFNELRSFHEGTALDADMDQLMAKIEAQEKLVRGAAGALTIHPFTIAASICNLVLETDTAHGDRLRSALKEAREGINIDPSVELSAEELSSYAKATIVGKRKSGRKSDGSTSTESPGAWEEFTAMTKTLVHYGCLVRDESDSSDFTTKFKISESGTQCGLLGFGNALGILLALGCVWEQPVTVSTNTISEGERLHDQSKIDSDELLTGLKSMTASELAGYVSCVIGDGNRDTTPQVEQFQQLESIQQQAIRMSFVLIDRFETIQEEHGVTQAFNTMLDVSNCATVTAWANGCTWNEALALSGLPPGDLARNLSRVLDALRQLGKLPFSPKRLDSSNCRGLDSQLKKRCREASHAISRYPVKDSFMLDDEEEEETEALESSEQQDPPDSDGS